MNMNLNNDEINEDFSSLFSMSDEQEVKHEARMIMYRFLSEIERTSQQKKGLKKRLAKSIKKSSSYITQLFNGDKLINLTLLAKIQKELKIKFKIIAYSESEFDYYSRFTNVEVTQNVFLYNTYLGYNKKESVKTDLKKSNDYIQVIQTSDALLS